MIKNKNYDVIIIGGGAAGMMASLIASQKGAKTLLIEKNNVLGKKLRITGKGRCNITNNISDIEDFIKKLNKNGKFLYSALSQFDIQKTLDFFNNKLDIKTKVERGERVFPVSDSAIEIVGKFTKALQKNNVEILLNTKIQGLNSSGKKIDSVKVGDEIFYAKNFILATGGLSYPATGSTGDGFDWLKKLGHSISKLRPGLVPIKCKEDYIKNLEGLSLKNVNIKILDSLDKKIEERFGEAIFTANGMSGPIILDLSSKITGLANEPLKLSIDFKPALSIDELDKRIQRDFLSYQNKMFKNAFDDLLPHKLIPTIINLSRIPELKTCNNITKNERQNLVRLLKNFELSIVGLESFERAIITVGGISLKEIDSKTMASKIIDNLFFAGEILDLDAPTGGFNLQICWTTGFVSGNSIKNCFT